MLEGFAKAANLYKSKNIVSLVHRGAYCALVVHIAPSWCTSTPYTVVVVYNVPWVNPHPHNVRTNTPVADEGCNGGIDWHLVSFGIDLGSWIGFEPKGGAMTEWITIGV